MLDNKVNFDYSQFGFMAVNNGRSKAENWEFEKWDIRLPLISPKIDNLGFYFQSFEQLKKDNRAEEYFIDSLKNKVWLSFEYRTGVGLIGKTPTIKDILYCVLADYQGETFSDWCNNFGYDNDSIKALKLYNECQENYNKLCKCIPSHFHDAIREDLQAY